MKDYVFHTTCVDSTAELIGELQGLARDSTYRTLLKHCEGLAEFFHELGYGRDSGLHPSRDWTISWAKSFYAGQPCYYFEWSRIEHIWLHRNCDWDEVQRREHETRRNPGGRRRKSKEVTAGEYPGAWDYDEPGDDRRMRVVFDGRVRLLVDAKFVARDRVRLTFVDEEVTVDAARPLPWAPMKRRNPADVNAGPPTRS